MNTIRQVLIAMSPEWQWRKDPNQRGLWQLFWYRNHVGTVFKERKKFVAMAFQTCTRARGMEEAGRFDEMEKAQEASMTCMRCGDTPCSGMSEPTEEVSASYKGPQKYYRLTIKMAGATPGCPGGVPCFGRIQPFEFVPGTKRYLFGDILTPVGYLEKQGVIPKGHTKLWKTHTDVEVGVRMDGDVVASVALASPHKDELRSVSRRMTDLYEHDKKIHKIEFWTNLFPKVSK